MRRAAICCGGELTFLLQKHISIENTDHNFFYTVPATFPHQKWRVLARRKSMSPGRTTGLNTGRQDKRPPKRSLGRKIIRGQCEVGRSRFTSRSKKVRSWAAITRRNKPRLLWPREIGVVKSKPRWHESLPGM